MAERPRRVGLDAATYDEQWTHLAAQGHDVHGEASFVEQLVAPPARVLDAGCGTGRVAVRLAARGYDVVGVDVDGDLLAHARAKTPQVEWLDADLATLGEDDVAGPFDAIVMAGNVMIFLAPGTEATVVRTLGDRLAPGGVLVAGFQLSTVRVTVDAYDDWARAAGLVTVARCATWSGDPFAPGGDYVVAVDRRPA